MNNATERAARTLSLFLPFTKNGDVGFCLKALMSFLDSFHLFTSLRRSGGKVRFSRIDQLIPFSPITLDSLSKIPVCRRVTRRKILKIKDNDYLGNIINSASQMKVIDKAR
jgi:hypothetical protein